VRAIPAYLNVLDRIDRYQTAAQVNQVYDDEARQKLLDKLSFMVDNVRAESAEDPSAPSTEAAAEWDPEGAEADDGEERREGGDDGPEAEREARKWLTPR
jgi:hypothetical protein